MQGRDCTPLPATGIRQCRDEASYLTHSSQHSSTGEHGSISSPPWELWLPSPKGSPSHCFSPRYCLCQDHGHPRTFWFAADISEAEDKTLNEEKVISSCSSLKSHGTEQQEAQHIQPLHHTVVAHKISPNPLLSSVQQLFALEGAEISLQGNRIRHCQEGGSYEGMALPERNGQRFPFLHVSGAQQLCFQ